MDSLTSIYRLVEPHPCLLRHFFQIFMHCVMRALKTSGSCSSPAPGGRSMFFKAKLSKESKNGFKIISCRRYPVIFFSKSYFWHQKSSKNWMFWWFLNFYVCSYLFPSVSLCLNSSYEQSTFLIIVVFIPKKTPV